MMIPRTPKEISIDEKRWWRSVGFSLSRYEMRIESAASQRLVYELLRSFRFYCALQCTFGLPHLGNRRGAGGDDDGRLVKLIKTCFSINTIDGSVPRIDTGKANEDKDFGMRMGINELALIRLER